ncbi:MAG: hypothetical protein LBF86_04340 [Helicobacteraceae bacterium]|jgi:hypothetical protein|nr:hypothetical protein [Helicobacteraceae bacterium]
MKSLLTVLFSLATLNAVGGAVKASAADSFKEVELKVRKITLFSSGVGFYELGGEINGASKIVLPFDLAQMNDALKSLTVYDSASVSPFVNYPSEETIKRTLESLRINLANEPSVEGILSSLKGEIVEIVASKKIRGKIVGVQTRQNAKDGASFTESVVTLFSDGELKQIAVKEIESYRFVNHKINEEFEKALLFLANANDGSRRTLNLYLDGAKKREALVSFVIAAPVWKANYRLDLSGKKPFLQGWAIIDNASDVDWENVTLSLAVGRPVSFTQPYYAPFYTSRPQLPLSIAGFASANTYEGGVAPVADIEDEYDSLRERRIAYPSAAPVSRSLAYEERNQEPMKNYATATAQAVGEQVVYTLKNKISLARRQSAMAPLTQGEIEAKKILIYNAAKGRHPALGIELINTLDSKLPAGAITIYDEGVYAGDALLEFLPLNEKRLINYGDDLSVRGIINQRTADTIDSVKISKGVITIATKRLYTGEYVFKNSAGTEKTLVVEHPITREAKLISPSKYGEKTESLYRFNVNLPADKETIFAVKEERVFSSAAVITGQPFSSLIAYSSNASYPAKVRDALKKAEPLFAELERQTTRLREANTNLERKIKDQDRIRSNLEAVGAESAQGKSYTTRLVDLDKEIAEINEEIDAATKDRDRAQKAYDDYIANLDV